VLRIAVAGEFIGHGMLALEGKKDWIAWTEQLTGMDTSAATTFILVVGIIDILIAFSILVKPMRAVLLWAAVWGVWTALLRPLVGLPIWDFVERWANWAAPLALFYLLQKNKPR